METPLGKVFLERCGGGGAGGGEQMQQELRHQPRELPGGRAVLGLTVSLQKSGGRGSGWGGADHQRSPAWEPGEVC